MTDSDTAAIKQLVQNLSYAVALVSPGSREILFENAEFFRWFALDTEPEATLDQRLPGFDLEKFTTRMEDRGKYSYEVETEINDRAVPIRVSANTINSDDGAGLYIVECQNISKERESQYMLDSYSQLAEKNAKDLQKEKERVERLLLNVMPKQVYEELKDYGTTTPQRFENASILMLDFVRFTDMAISQDPSSLVSELNDIFSAFDRIVEMFGCERIRTMGDSYMAVSGIPEASTDHAKNVAKVALRMRRYLEKRNGAHSEQWRARIGINTGPVIGSLVGIQKYVYDLFGPGVNLAARMESLSEPMRITLNENTRESIRDDFVFTEREEVDVKGFGPMQLYFLESEVA